MSEELTVIEKENKEIQPINTENSVSIDGVSVSINEIKQKIAKQAADKIQDEKMIDKHSDNLAKISDRALEVEEEKQRLIVEQVNANNKVVEQEIKNRLIVLNAEAKRLQAEQKQLNKEQKAEHKRRNKEAQWELYKDKLQKMKYTYVPNAFILKMLLFFDGVKSFFDGLGAVSTAIVKAFKWVIILGLIIGVIMFIPATREWFLSLLQFK